MSETIRIIAHDGSALNLERCEEKLSCFCLYDAYEDYDAIASSDDVVTRKQFDAVNNAMKANLPPRPWQRFISPNPVPNLAAVPTDIDLIDSSDEDYVHARDGVRRVYEVLCSDPEISDMGSSKVCYLKRPRLIAISDSYVRSVVVGPDIALSKSDPKRGEKFADRGIRVLDTIRRIGVQNQEPLQNLQPYVNNLSVAGRPVRLSMGRIIDILLWVEVAIQKRNSLWTAWREGRLSPEIRCPRCGKPMVRRPRKDGSGEFYGCPRYPSCKGARSIS